MYVRTDAIDEIEGPIAEHVIEDEDGRSAVLGYCKRCLTVLWAGRVEVEAVRGLNAGCLEGTAGLTPYGNMWTQSARPWVAFAPGPRFEASPDDPLAMIHAWQGRPRDPS